MKKSMFLLATTVMASVGTHAAWAQTADTKDTAKAADTTEVVVTGSRLKKKTTFNSPSAIDVITSSQADLMGLSDTSQILQTSTVAANASQIDNGYTGYVVNGGPGVNTLSLRGLGTSRTLVLLNGHRVGPAGTRGAVGAVDLNTIPNSMVDRTEILKDGASSIYGSDAVAGVVNVITKQSYTGGSFKAVVSVPEQGGGEKTNFSFSQGFHTGRFYGSVGVDYSDQQALNLGDRKWASCPQAYVFNADGSRADYVDASTGTYKCNILSNGYIYTNSRYYLPDSTATKGGNNGYDLNGLHRVYITYPTTTSNYVDLTRASKAELPYYSSKFLNKNIVSPVTRSSFVFNGGYKLNDTTKIYVDLLANQRDSSQNSWRQLYPTVAATNPNNIAIAGNSYGLTATSAYSVIAIPSIYNQRVDYSRGLIGMKGIFPDYGSLKNWTWDVAAQISLSKGTYGNTFVYNDRVLATTAAGTVCNTSYLTTATSCPTGGVQWFRPSTVSTGVFTAEEAAFLFGYEEGHTAYQQSYVEANFAGDLFNLKTGTVSGAFGFQVRREAISDVPGTQARASNYWGSTTAGITRGSDMIKEAYAEVSAPLVKNFPLVKSLDIDISGRYSDYRSYGSSTTYKAGVNWSLTDTVRIRGSKGSSFRAPGLYERFLGGQTGYSSQSTVDPCYQIVLGTLTSYSSTMAANCAAAGISSSYTGGSSATVISGGNGSSLKAETSDNQTIGLIWSPKFAKLQVSVDYFSTKINNEITQFGSYNIVYQCYDSVNLSSPYCKLLNRATAATGTYVAGNITTINNNYQNVAEEYQRGIDFDISYTHNFRFGRLSFSNNNTFINKWTWQLFTDTKPTDELNMVGYPGYNGKVNLSFQRGRYTISYNADLVGPTSNYKYYGTNVTNNFGYTGVTVYNKMGTEFYANHTISVRKQLKDWTVVGTIRNILNEDPPAISSAYSSRIGNAPLTSQYDLYGRTFVMNIERRW